MLENSNPTDAFNELSTTFSSNRTAYEKYRGLSFSKIDTQYVVYYEGTKIEETDELQDLLRWMEYTDQFMPTVSQHTKTTNNLDINGWKFVGDIELNSYKWRSKVSKLAIEMSKESRDQYSVSIPDVLSSDFIMPLEKSTFFTSFLWTVDLLHSVSGYEADKRSRLKELVTKEFTHIDGITYELSSQLYSEGVTTYKELANEELLLSDSRKDMIQAQARQALINRETDLDEDPYIDKLRREYVSQNI